MFLFLALLAADPVAVQSAPAPIAAAVPAEKKVCWRDQATGSIMPGKRICMTVAERRAWVARMQGNVNSFANRPQAACAGGGFCEK